MSKSVVIVGKGPSVLKSTREFIGSFDEVAICNFPPIDGYEQYLGERATYHFLNVHDPNPYNKDRLNSLGLKYMFNTHYASHGGYQEIFPDHDVLYLKDYGEKMLPEFREKYGFDPPCGVIAFDFFLKKEEFDTIGLVGIDFFKVGERGYYYSVQEVQKSHHYLYNSNGSTPFNLEGVRMSESPHNSEKSKKFIYDMATKYDKKLRIIK